MNINKSFLGRSSMLAVAVLVVGGGVALASDSSRSDVPTAAAGPETVFTVVERATTDTVVYVNPTHDDVIGNTLGFGNSLYGPQNVKRVGRDQGLCYRTNPGKSWECTFTNVLPHGRITVQGVFPDSLADSRMAITGGTGKYAAARGYMVLHARNKAGTAYDFEFHVL